MDGSVAFGPCPDNHLTTTSIRGTIILVSAVRRGYKPPMMIPLQCRCGAVRGELDSARPLGRLICHCDDCQTAARALRRDDILDAHGGTDIFQVAPRSVRITMGAEHIACLRLSDTGLMRWHTACCQTPMGNTLPSPTVAFVGVPTTFMAVGGTNTATRTLDDALGPAQARLQGKVAVAGLSPPMTTFPARFIARSALFLLRNRLLGRHRPHPFFVDGKPIVAPRVLTTAERDGFRPSPPKPQP
jgi:hypothetical protein